jgi:hypothetical protein
MGGEEKKQQQQQQQLTPSFQKLCQFLLHCRAGLYLSIEVQVPPPAQLRACGFICQTIFCCCRRRH